MASPRRAEKTPTGWTQVPQEIVEPPGLRAVAQLVPP
jgi:hypothetical protein